MMRCSIKTNLLNRVCTNSLYCLILQKSDDHKAETWKENIDKLAVKGYSPNSVIFDRLSSLQLGITMVYSPPYSHNLNLI
ncbi:MAG: hypothetical protein ACI8TE_000866 [Francisella sp.]|jgi:hypothetical protein